MKHALVIGGSRGIGRAISLRLAQSGFAIWLTYLSNHDAARGVKEEIEALGGSCELIPFDVSSYEETEAALSERLERVSPDVLVYNSGIARDNLLMWMTKDEWNSVISTNLNGFFNVTRQVVFAMLKAKKGRIVVISSTSGQVGQPGQVNYSASKAGLIGSDGNGRRPSILMKSECFAYAPARAGSGRAWSRPAPPAPGSAGPWPPSPATASTAR